MEEKLPCSFGYALEELQRSLIQLSAFQKDAIKSIVLGKDTFVGLPTGHDKSLLFECFPHCLDFMTKDTGEPNLGYCTDHIPPYRINGKSSKRPSSKRPSS